MIQEKIVVAASGVNSVTTGSTSAVLALQDPRHSLRKGNQHGSAAHADLKGQEEEAAVKGYLSTCTFIVKMHHDVKFNKVHNIKTLQGTGGILR